MRSEDEEIGLFVVVCSVVLAIITLWWVISARAELIRPDNCDFLKEGILQLEALQPNISERDLAVLLMLKEWHYRSGCPALPFEERKSPTGCTAKEGETCL